MGLRWKNGNKEYSLPTRSAKRRNSLMTRRIATGIDIGTHQVKLVVLEEFLDKKGVLSRKILGTGIAETKGVRHGYVVNKEEVAHSIREAKHQAEATAHVPITSAFLAVGGISLDEARATGNAIISRADQEVTQLDVDKAIATAKEAAAPAFLNRRVLHTIPLEFRIDGSKVLGDPVHMKGVRLEVDCLFITCLTQHDDALAAAVEAADIEVIDQMAAPLASASILLDGEQRMKGCVLANIGAETISIVVYDEGLPISIKVFPMGSSHITEDIALGFRISLEEAERVKLQRLTGQMYPRKKVDDLIATRLLAMFTLVEKHLKSLARHHHLPAGIIISGGGSGIGSISDIAKDSLKLPARLAEFRISPDAKMRDATWAVAYGLARWGLTGETNAPKKSVFMQLTKFFKQFLP